MHVQLRNSFAIAVSVMETKILFHLTRGDVCSICSKHNNKTKYYNTQVKDGGEVQKKAKRLLSLLIWDYQQERK